jgi:hypothetical protein
MYMGSVAWWKGRRLDEVTGKEGEVEHGPPSHKCSGGGRDLRHMHGICRIAAAKMQNPVAFGR